MVLPCPAPRIVTPFAAPSASWLSNSWVRGGNARVSPSFTPAKAPAIAVSGALAAIETQRPAPLQSGLLDPMGDAVAGADGELLLQPVATTPSRHAKPPASLRVRARGACPPARGATNR